MRDIVYEMMHPKKEILFRKAGCIIGDTEFTLTFKYDPYGAGFCFLKSLSSLLQDDTIHYVIGISKIEPEESIGDYEDKVFMTKFFANRYFNKLMEKYPFKEEK